MNIEDAQFIADLRQRTIQGEPVSRDDYRRMLEIIRGNRILHTEKLSGKKKGKGATSTVAPASDEDLAAMFQ